MFGNSLSNVSIAKLADGQYGHSRPVKSSTKTSLPARDAASTTSRRSLNIWPSMSIFWLNKSEKKKVAAIRDLNKCLIVDFMIMLLISVDSIEMPYKIIAKKYYKTQ